MAKAAVCLPSLTDLRQHVHETLCRHENLLPEQFQLQETPLQRLGNRCGLQFCLRGPRSIRLGAVWSSEQSLLYFYDATGERFLKEPLAVQPTCHT
jgi:hypothetical protein